MTATRAKEVQKIEKEELVGYYEKIVLMPSLPQGIQSAVPMKLGKDGYYECCSIQGKWEYIGNNMICIIYGPNKEICYAGAVWDHESNKPTVALTGMSEKGIACWAKRIRDL